MHQPKIWAGSVLTEVEIYTCIWRPRFLGNLLAIPSLERRNIVWRFNRCSYTQFCSARGTANPKSASFSHRQVTQFLRGLPAFEVLLLSASEARLPGSGMYGRHPDVLKCLFLHEHHDKSELGPHICEGVDLRSIYYAVMRGWKILARFGIKPLGSGSTCPGRCNNAAPSSACLWYDATSRHQKLE